MKRGDLVRVVRRIAGVDFQFGQVGRILRMEAASSGNGEKYVVVFSVDGSEPPTELLDRKIPSGTEYERAGDPMTGDPFFDDEEWPHLTYRFAPEDLKPLEESQQYFWKKYLERHAAHRGDVRREANRACNHMRNHREEEAVRKAAHCNMINLFLSAQDQPHGFRRATRLSLEQYIELCQRAYSDFFMDGVQDILFHMLFENRESHQIGDLIPVCMCGKKE